MLKIYDPLRRPALSTLVVLVLACFGMTACGSSGKTTASAGATSTASPSTRTPGAGRGGARFAALRECLKKSGITLPQRPPGGRRAGGPGFLGAGAGGPGGAGGPQLPKGVSGARFQAAIAKCGGGFARRGFGGLKSRFSTPQAKKQLATFATCMRANGVKIGEPNTSGTGPLFSAKGINTKTAQFAAAETKCRSDLLGLFGAARGATPPPSTG
jgi:hypothetical protein